MEDALIGCWALLLLRLWRRSALVDSVPRPPLPGNADRNGMVPPRPPRPPGKKRLGDPGGGGTEGSGGPLWCPE
eukprot:8798363-Pyramimonas_sp.AAC.2